MHYRPDARNVRVRDLRALLWGGLQRHHPMPLERVGDLLQDVLTAADGGSADQLAEQLARAVAESFPPRAPAATPATQTGQRSTPRRSKPASKPAARGG